MHFDVMDSQAGAAMSCLETLQEPRETERPETQDIMGRFGFAVALGSFLHAKAAEAPVWTDALYGPIPAPAVGPHGYSVDYVWGKGYRCLNVSADYEGEVNVTDFTQKYTSSVHNNKTCYTNLKWAMDTGVKTMGKCYPNLTTASSMYQFQWALFANAGFNDCVGWGCPLPCGMAQEAVRLSLNQLNLVYQGVAPTAPPTMPPTAPPTVAAPAPTPAPTEAPAGFPVWGIVLLALGAVAICGAIGFYMTNQGKGAQKKKRAVTYVKPQPKPVEQKPLVSPPPPPVRMVMNPVVTTAVPISTAAPIASYMVQQPAPVPITTVQAAPQYQYAQQPSYMAAPASMSYAAPTMVMQAGRPQTAMELFDELDLNKDGRVSREEFQRVAEQRGIPM